jgi:hypothetical protein
MPATYQGYSQQQWARLFNTTLAEHRQGMEENMMRNYQMGALLESNGRVTYNHSGNGFDWNVQFKLPPASGNTGEQTRNFVRRNYNKVANLDWRGYEVTDSMTWFEFLANKGEEGIVKIFDTMVGNLTKGLKQHFGRQYYIDGNATGNETCWHGFESMFGINSSLETIAVDGTGARAFNQADYVANPSDTYAGISTVLGTYGGEQETSVAWPHGVASPEYDFWSPLIIMFDSTAFGATDDTFDKGDEAIRYGLTHSQRNMGGLDEQITQVFLDRELYRAFKKAASAKEEIIVDNASQGTLRSLGFKNTFIFDGVEVTFENGVPNRVGYGFNINAVELASMDSTLLKTETEWDMRTQSYNAVVSTLSNMVFRNGPRNLFKLIEYDTVAAA